MTEKPELPDLPDLVDLVDRLAVDDRGWSPDGAFHDGVVRRGRRLRRRRRLAGGSAALACSVLATVALAGGLANRNLDRVERIDVAALEPDGDAAVTAPDGPVVLVLAGVDTDDGLAEVGGVEDPVRPPGPSRSDTVVVARLDPDAGTLTVLPLPRDLWGEIPGQAPGRINAALPAGGPDLLIRTIEARLGVEVDHYLQTDFAGAVAIGDAVGGVRVALATPVRDRQSGLDLPAGCQVVRGPQLLALGRARHLQSLVDGSWVADPTSDLGRIERQQALATALLAQLTDLGAADPVELYRLTDTVADHLVVDASLTTAELRGLARSLQGVQVRTLRLPVVDRQYDGAAVLELSPGAEWVLDAFRRGTPAVSDDATASDPVATASDAVVPRAC